MPWAGEEERAAAYRASLRARQRATVARERALWGNPVARAALRARWAWLLDPPVEAIELEELPDSSQNI